MIRRLSFLALLGLALTAAVVRADLNEDYETVTREAVAKAAPSVVQIVTQGGTDLIVTDAKGPAFRKALGPTTGLILSADGYIISSAFNFINEPKTILIEVPGRKEKFLAKKVATDKSRMLTLLKIEAKDLPVLEAVPKKELAVGQLSLALGRTLDVDQNNPPSVSVGIISALNRVWGRCLQTDAHTSPTNYGGPLIDVRGRVQGIIIPASPRGTDETAGFEWYDSGIGFAVPMHDVLAVLPKLKEGKDLKRGLLGVQMPADIYGSEPVVNGVSPNSAAAKAGLQKGDVLTEVEGQPVVSMAQVLHILGPKYEGDTIALKYRRGGKETVIKALELVGDLTMVANAYLGILPLRDDPKLGVEIRHVFPDSPAAKSGLKTGDRIVKYGQGERLQPFSGKQRGQNELRSFLNSVQPAADIKLEVTRKDGKTETVAVKLAALPGTGKDDKAELPDNVPDMASAKKAQAPLEQAGKKGGAPRKDDKDGAKKDAVETGLLKHTTANGNQSYYVHVHENYDPNVAQALLIWLHPPGKNKEADIQSLSEAWNELCKERHILIVAPLTDSENGWVPSDSRAVQEVIRDVLGRYTVDENRIVAHGMGVGGQMAIYLGFHARDLVRGVATTGAVATGVKDNIPTQRLAFFLVAGDRDPLAKAIADSVDDLRQHKLPVHYRAIMGQGRQYLTEEVLGELVRWIDILDRL